MCLSVHEPRGDYKILPDLLTEFDLGPKLTCESDFVKVYDYNIDTDVKTLKTTYCGGVS